jgi:hypothetical protein
MTALASLATALIPGLATKTSRAIIIELGDDDSIMEESALDFQYFPDSISDSKSINWAPKEIPGGSLPLYQWVNSGERRISFTSVFTTDVDFSTKGQGGGLQAASLVGRLKSSGSHYRNIDIRAAVYWLRRFLLPRYGDDTAVGVPLTKAPHKLQLHMPNTGIGRAGGAGGGTCRRDWLTCIMTGCDVTWESFFASGFPRVATVSLSFAQVAQYKGQISFPSATYLDEEIKGASTEGGDGDASYTFGYTLKKG